MRDLKDMSLFRVLECPLQRLPRLVEMLHHVSQQNMANGGTAFLFAATGPLAIILTVATRGGLSTNDINSWIFAAFGLGGALSIGASLAFRQPLGMAWTIPGTVLLSTALDHLAFADILGAYWVVGIGMAVLACTGWVGRLMRLLPLPIIMGMVAAVFLPFGLKIIAAFHSFPVAACVTVGSFVLVSRYHTVARSLPPVLVALLCGGGALVSTGQVPIHHTWTLTVTTPVAYMPRFAWQAMAELVLPLTIAVLAAQNAQGFAVLTSAGHRPPVNMLTLLCGVGSCVFALFGSVSTCVTGPSNAILVSSGARETQYLGGVIFGLCMVFFGLFAPTATALALALPASFIALVGGLAMLPVLRSAFHIAFSTQCQLGALVAFLITLADVQLWHIGAAFWGLVGGFCTSWLLESDALRALHRTT